MSPVPIHFYVTLFLIIRCAFCSQTIILWIMHFIPGLRLRASEDAEILGIDDAEMGEFAYDYVGIDAGVNHAYIDDTHSHGDIPATTGGREPKHMHAHTTIKPASSTEGSEGEKAA